MCVRARVCMTVRECVAFEPSWISDIHVCLHARVWVCEMPVSI